MDRDNGGGRSSPPLASTSKSTLFNNKEKEKWSKLIPEDLIGGSSASRSRRPGSRQRRSGFGGVVSLSRCYVIVKESQAFRLYFNLADIKSCY